MNHLVSSLCRGVEFHGFTLKIGELKEGRIVGHRYASLYVAEHRSFLMVLGMYEGKPPYYLPWIEWFSVDPSVLGNKFFGSEVEKRLMGLCASELPDGGKLFVEYSEDMVTGKELSRGVPPPLTRMGFLMLQQGFTWFKDWYFPEGFNEGGQKLQGEKPLDRERRDAHMEVIRREVEGFMAADDDIPEEILKRCEVILTDKP